MIARTGLLALLVAAGCTDAMVDQRKLEPLESSRYFRDGNAVRHPPGGVLDVEDRSEAPPENTDRALLLRGRDRYGIFCAPCHGAAGYGDGIVVERGFDAPLSFHTDAMRSLSERELYEVVRDGRGVMAGFAADLSPRDRWAVVGWVRALQLSQHAPVDLVSDEARAELEGDQR